MSVCTVPWGSISRGGIWQVPLPPLFLNEALCMYHVVMGSFVERKNQTHTHRLISVDIGVDIET